MSSPALDSDTSKSAAMSVRRPIGMNSDMFTMKTQIAMEIRGSHCLGLKVSPSSGSNSNSYKQLSNPQR